MSNEKDKLFTRVNIPVDITEKDMSDILVTAFEGGIGYWAIIVGYNDPDPLESKELYIDYIWTDNPKRQPRYSNYPMTSSGAVILQDCEDDDGPTFTLNREALIKGLNAMGKKDPDGLKRIIDQDYDAGDADNFIQFACFGEVVYG